MEDEILLFFRVTELEKAIIKERMRILSINDMGKYLRQVAIKSICKNIPILFLYAEGLPTFFFYS